jgi:hypothetical protein
MEVIATRRIVGNETTAVPADQREVVAVGVDATHNLEALGAERVRPRS